MQKEGNKMKQNETKRADRQMHLDVLEPSRKEETESTNVGLVFMLCQSTTQNFLANRIASLEEFPYIVAVINKTSENTSAVVCLGCIIGQLNEHGVVLTAGSCILEIASASNSTYVIKELQSDIEYEIHKWKLPTNDDGRQPAIGLIAVRGHWKGIPNYSFKHPWPIRPAPTNERVTVATIGFNRGLNHIVINKDIKILTRDRCVKEQIESLGSIGSILTNTTFCVESRDDIAVGLYYSFPGGPVLSFNNNEAAWIGITINSPQKLSTNSPAVAVNISLYENFIGNVFWIFDKGYTSTSDRNLIWSIDFCKVPLMYKDITLNDVTVYLYTKNHRTDGIKLPRYQQKVPPPFDPNKKSLFLIHGWTGAYTDDVEQLIKNAALNSGDLNVFLIDWSGPAKALGNLVVPYIPSVQSVPKVGDIVGEFIYKIIRYHNYSPDNITIIGHSLGAHVAGFAGASVFTKSNKKVKHIIGSDPAGPCYIQRDKSERLDKTDAQFVQIVHTATDTWGTDQTGSADYYVNGGRYQPGCSDTLPSYLIDFTNIRYVSGLIFPRNFGIGRNINRNFYSQPTFYDRLADVFACSHQRSFQYIAESIYKNCGFVAHLCDGWDDFEKGLCTKTATSYMGRLEIDNQARGKYYLKTNARSPYSKEVCSHNAIQFQIEH